ncbi:porin family protein [Lacinutrix neustonica]|uniref:Porin family protein n=1 Tax=Lacinutrix neustonica TaxID=2980107 RepID=A0A9E8MXL4_9FLAO|nr:porin family protein [Lacinutrix neustonica]WAC02881.1 porin family protein [Lacinutrix neustonica]
MKKLLFTAAIAVLGFTTVNAQEVQFGAKAGVNFATLSGDNVDGVDSKTGFHVGVVAEIMVSEKFSFQPEIMYSAQGASTSYSETQNFGGDTYSYEEEEKAKLNYINLPLMGKFYVAEGFSVEAGPQIGFLISAKGEYEYSETLNGVTQSGSEEEDIENISSVDLGVNFGLGYKLDNGLNFGARYNLGLSNINDYEGADNNKVHNNVIQVSVGFMF